MARRTEADQVVVVERPDGTSEVTLAGSVRVVEARSREEARELVGSLVSERAAALGRPVRVLTRSADGDSAVVVLPSGAVRPGGPEGADGAGDPDAFDVDAEPEAGTTAATAGAGAAGPVPDPAGARPRAKRPWGYDYPGGRSSFLRRSAAVVVAERGWRGRLNRAGLRLAPGAAERAERADARTASQHWAGPRTVVVVNPKGGAGKTPTTAMLAAVLARHGGGTVLAWESSQTRGTLGWRTEQVAHAATSSDLLPEATTLLGRGSGVADLARFVHHQHADRYDVLRSQPLALHSEQRMDLDDVDLLHEVATTYYRLVLVDSGNDQSEPTWLRMLERAHQVVVPTTTRDDHAEAGALLLEALAARDERSARLAASAVVLVTRADPRASAKDVRRVVQGLRPLAREVLTVPFDPQLVDGQLRYDALRPATRRAWLAAAAAVGRGL
ncbi:ATPase [Quadrisphaera sp. KR29]|uniref:ATPase n=1 Tax=Quadrisphaera sp. KR29 TaxID=3461391 RepID=UPI0040448F33